MGENRQAENKPSSENGKHVHEAIEGTNHCLCGVHIRQVGHRHVKPSGYDKPRPEYPRR